MVMVPYDRNKARQDLIDLFAPLLTDSAILSNPSLHLSTLQAMGPSLPVPLRPTTLQLSRPHYYGIDMLASPRLRDRLMNVSMEVAQAFITDFDSSKSDGEDEGPVIIWGEDPLNEMAWEFSRDMLVRWGWLLGPDWMLRANFWRRQRGAEGLSVGEW
jgi:hypothetical protein